MVTIIATLYGPTVWNGIDYIAKSIDGDSLAADAPSTELYFNVEDDSKEKIRIVESQQANYSLSLPMSNEQSIFPVTSAAIVIMNKVPTSEVFSQPSFNNVSTKSFGKIISKLNSIDPPVIFEPLSLVMRLIAAAGTLGSGCSLGPEGPSVELGAGFSRVFADPSSRTTSKEKHHLFLAGTAAGVAAGFGAPIAGVFFALECGNRILAKNTIKLEEDASDAPRADIAAIVLSATMSNIMVQLFLQHRETLFIQGNNYSMQSPFFELPIYLGLSIISGLISVSFELLRDIFKSMYKRIKVPKVYRPLLGGLLCGIAAIYYPQTLFNGYSTLEELLSTRTMLNDMSDFTLIVQLLGLKIILSSFSLASGLIGGVFAPSLFLGAAAGSSYYYVVKIFASYIKLCIINHTNDISYLYGILQDFQHSVFAFSVSSSQTFDISPPANPATIISQLLTFFSVSTTQAYATGNNNYFLNRFTSKHLSIYVDGSRSCRYSWSIISSPSDIGNANV